MIPPASIQPGRKVRRQDPARGVPGRLLFLTCVLVSIIAMTDAIRAQVSVTPPRLLLDHRERSAEVIVYNQSSNLVEVSTDLAYSVQYSDSLGNSGLREPSTEEEEAKRCDAWMQVYPFRFSIPPNSSRTVRVLATPPAGPDAGEYWARLRFTATPATFDIAALTDTSVGIDARIRTRIVLDLPIILRIGHVSTSVVMDEVVVRRSGLRHLDAVIKTVRTGNAAYRGTMYGELLTTEGDPVARASAQFTTEFSYWRSLSFHPVPAGDYILRVRTVSEKKGSAMDAVIISPTVETSYGIQVSDTGAVVTSAP